MERKTFGKTIAEHQAIQLKLAEMSTRAAAAELLVHQAASKFDQQERCDLEAGPSQIFCLRSGSAKQPRCHARLWRL